MPRLHCPVPLASGQSLALPPGAARHVQVLRMQPGQSVTLFDGGCEGGLGGEFDAVIERMGRSDVQVQVGAHRALEREAAREVHLALGIPANERMDWLVEKATELGVASIQPLQAERSVLRLQGERTEKKRSHWEAIAIAACEQCGRNRVPLLHAPQPIGPWLAGLARAQPAGQALRLLLSLGPQARALREAAAGDGPLTLLSGPEGGLSPAEEAAARAAGFAPVSLGPRVLRAETAPLAVLAALALG